jgi:EAL domain-containing protein (putative c-di-GMP-specific phosphodiesterase class I)
MNRKRSVAEPAWFRPIVDTFEQRILGYECHPGAGIAAIDGLCFIDFTASESILKSDRRPADVIVEFAEPDLTRDPVRLCRIYTEFRARGFGTALTVARSLGAVQELLPDYIKLDDRLIRNIHRPACASTIGALVGLAERFGLQVIAEGVARRSAVEDLWLLGVRFMQGSLFLEPVPRNPGHYTRICHSRLTPRFLTSMA